uniref:GDH/6PGL endoplasmic bifunctional protein n=1 Tax=Jaculus jaculus TaxID=51337 RepID=UPI001E1B37F6|nr:GDH/6PGL endoplasmic bifunctional protein [Jaculus jaculus]
MAGRASVQVQQLDAREAPRGPASSSVAGTGRAPVRARFAPGPIARAPGAGVSVAPGRGGLRPARLGPVSSQPDPPAAPPRRGAVPRDTRTCRGGGPAEEEAWAGVADPHREAPGSDSPPAAPVRPGHFPEERRALRSRMKHPGLWKMFSAALYMTLLGCLQAQELQGHISIILLGATGDLAKKYLWQGLFQLYLDEGAKGHSFSFHGAALTAPQQGQELMAKALESLSCPKDVAPSNCAELKGQFLRLSQYRQLKTAEDYQTLSKDIEAQVQHKGLQETGRIFYFSVPPFAYADIARNINSSCRPGPGAWLRVVLEKPFGHDQLSAQQLASELGSFFQEEEMYRVDHYLGKQAVAQILPFRDQNRKALDGLWNRHHVERVEIIMKETVDAEGA